MITISSNEQKIKCAKGCASLNNTNDNEKNIESNERFLRQNNHNKKRFYEKKKGQKYTKEEQIHNDFINMKENPLSSEKEICQSTS